MPTILRSDRPAPDVIRTRSVGTRPSRPADALVVEVEPNASAEHASGSAEAHTTRANAMVGGRRPADSSFLGVRITPAGAEALVEMQEELAQVQARIAAADQSIDGLVRSIDGNLAKIQQDRAELVALQKSAKSSQSKGTILGGILTVAGFAIGGPFGAAVGNAVGFKTIASHEGLRREINNYEREIASNTARTTSLQTRRNRLVEERAALRNKAEGLRAREATWIARHLTTVDGAPPLQRLSDLAAARHEGQALIDDARAVLGDFRLLAARAAELATDVEQLRQDLARQVEQLQSIVAAAERAIESAIFDLAFAVIGVANGVGLLRPGEAGILKRALAIARQIDAPTKTRVGQLARVLVSTVLPNDAGLAKKVAASAVGILAAEAVAPSTDAELRSALVAALGEASGHMLDELASLDGTPSLRPVLEAFVALPAADRVAASTIFNALAAVPLPDDE